MDDGKFQIACFLTKSKSPKISYLKSNVSSLNKKKQMDLAIHSQRVITPEGITNATIGIENGKIVQIEKGLVKPENGAFTSVGNAVLMPGIVDAHVHINEPGRTDWEGFDTATRAAAFGGITSVVDMPLNSSPVTTNVDALTEKIAAAKGQLHINCGFWGGLVPYSLYELEPLLNSGVLGIKVFLTHSGIDEFPNVTEDDLFRALPLLAQYQLPLLAHCELDSSHENEYLLKENPKSYAAYLASRPKSWENEAVRLMLDLCRQFYCPTHIVHLVSTEALAAIQQAKKEELPVTVETCPHYLYFASEAIKDGQTAYKCAPPIREKANQTALWQALKDGDIDFIASDHSPAPPDIKGLESGNFETAWGGIAGLQFTLPATWTAAQQQGCSLEQLAQWLCARPAEFIGWGQQKGKIAIGYDADLVVWQPEAAFTVTEKMIQHKHKITPYLGEKLYGKVEQTYLAGQKIMENGQLLQKNKGRLLLR